MRRENSRVGNIVTKVIYFFFKKMHFNIFLDISWLFVQMVWQNTGVMVIMVLGWGLAMIFMLRQGGEEEETGELVSGSRNIYFSQMHGISKVGLPITIYIPEE